MDIELGVYRSFGASADVLTLIEAALPLGEAAACVGAFCGLTPIPFDG